MRRQKKEKDLKPNRKSEDLKARKKERKRQETKS